MPRRKLVLQIILVGITVPFLYLVGRTGYRLYRWANFARPPVEAALPALDSNGAVLVEEDRWISFIPQQAYPRVGLILYPGARIDPRAYAPLAQHIAREGFLVVLLPVRFALANYQPNAAAPVMDAYPEIKTWVVGGHSLGGVVAAEFTNRRSEEIEGLVLWAAYPSETQDLSAVAVDVISIHASRDGLVTMQEIADTKSLLPDNTEYVLIEGGNHAQYAWYGSQRNDFTATIDAETQQELIIRATVRFLRNLEQDTAASD